jgi:hypothetical protein
MIFVDRYGRRYPQPFNSSRKNIFLYLPHRTFAAAKIVCPTILKQDLIYEPF